MLPSNQKFGYFFSFIFSGISVYAFFNALIYLAFVSLCIAIIFLLASLIRPQILSPLNKIWNKIGLLLGLIVSPIVLGFIFFFLISSIALITRIFGRDELKLKKRSNNSYWVKRSSPGPSGNSFRNQY